MKKARKKLFLSIIMSVMMVFAMMPAMAYADDATTGSITSIDTPLTLNAGSQTTVTATYTANGDAHIDWSVTNGTGSATINKHKGQLTGVSAGTVTVTATLVTGAQPSSGGGNQQGCGGTTITSSSATVTINAATAYGFQGEGGNTLKLVSPSDITFNSITTKTVDGVTYNVYNNSINTAVTAENGYIYFDYTMSAGINNFKQSTFNGYKSEIILLDADGNQVGGHAEYASFTSPNVKIKFNTNIGTEEEPEYLSGNYTLQFGPSVCGNNTGKKLNCYLNFDFTI